MSETKAGTEKKRPWRNKFFFLTDPSLHPLISYTTHDHMARSGTNNSVLNLLKSITNHENTPSDLPTVQSDGRNSSTEVPFLFSFKLKNEPTHLIRCFAFC